MKKSMILVIIVLLFLYILFHHFIYNDTIEKAIKNEAGTSFRTIPMIDDDHALAFLENKPGMVRVISLSKRMFGWKMENEIELPINNDESGFNKLETTLEFDSGVKVQLILVVILDETIGDVDIYAKNHTELGLNTTHSANGTVLYYWLGQEALSELTYKAYSTKGKLLYEQ